MLSHSFVLRFKRPLSFSLGSWNCTVHTLPIFRFLDLIDIYLCVRFFTDGRNSPTPHRLLASQARGRAWSICSPMHPSHPVITSKLESSHSLTSHPSVYHHRPFVISFKSIASVPIHFFFCTTAPFPLLCMTALVATHVDRVLWRGIGYDACMYFWLHLY